MDRRLLCSFLKKRRKLVVSGERKGRIGRLAIFRRSGLLLAVELGESAKLYRLMELFKEVGIMSDWFLYCDTAFRISPPLTISEEEIRESVRLILQALDRL